MSAVCLLDTSVFVEILNVPGKSNRHDEAIEELQQKIEGKELLFLPMATIIETGNHVGQNGSGGYRRKCAERFVEQVQKALNGDSPFKPLSFLSRDDLQMWLAEFPNHVLQGSGLGDLSIIQDWKRQCELNKGRRVYVWTLDGHLGTYDRPSGI